MKVNNKFNLSLIKYNALKLRANYQLPYKLVYYITKLDKDSDIALIKILMQETEHLLRIKGYYKKYPKIENEVNQQIEEIVTKMGSTN